MMPDEEEKLLSVENPDVLRFKAPFRPDGTLKPLTIIVSAFPEGHFSRVEAVLRVDFDLCVSGKPNRERRARLEGAIERALRALVIEMEEG
jgi:hypothetical protein